MSEPRPEIRAFLDALEADGWDGTIRTECAARVVLATDNSIYERLPAAVLEPRSLGAMAQAMRAVAGPAPTGSRSPMRW